MKPGGGGYSLLGKAQLATSGGKVEVLAHRAGTIATAARFDTVRIEL